MHLSPSLVTAMAIGILFSRFLSFRLLFRKEIDDGEKERSGEDRDEVKAVEIRITNK